MAASGCLRYVAAHDSGRIVHPRLAENQVSGGVLQFLGIALREELYLDKHRGVTLNANFLEHKVLVSSIFRRSRSCSPRSRPCWPLWR